MRSERLGRRVALPCDRPWVGVPYEHGLHSTLLAMRLAERLEVDTETAFQTYDGCLLFYVGCTVDAEMSAELLDDGLLL